MTEQIINPRTPIANDVPVTAAAPLPCSSQGAPPADTGTVINPVVWVVNGIAVSASNPMPITLV